jgi:Na+-transporting methylmalonyl-CoA/oxaloacetate decarboxylase gamma subunit
MSSNMLIAFQIAFFGMVIVFTAILLIWILISFITLIGSRQKTSPNLTEESIRKQKAAALAVAQALMEKKKNQLINYHLPPTAIVSAWQLSMRTNQMKKSGKKND